MSEKKVVITAVHGTFAPNAEWIKTSSPLMSYLTKNLSGDIETEHCKWSGGNNQSARLEGAKMLASHIVKVAEKHDGGVDQFLVAHSHGGNVALSACSCDRVAALVRGVVCLNTPFLYFRPTASRLTWVGAIISLFVGIVNLAGWLIGTALWITPFIWLPTIVIALFIIFTPISSPIKQESDTRLNTKLGSDGIYIMKSVGDEALGLIGGAAFANWLAVFFSGSVAHRFFRLIGGRQVLLAFFFLAVLVGMSLMTVEWYYPAQYSQLMPPIDVPLVLNLVFYALLTPISILWMLRVFTTGFVMGWDIPIRYGSQIVTAEPVPSSGAHTFTLVEPMSVKTHRIKDLQDNRQYQDNLRPEALKHSEIYSDPAVSKAVANWINQRLNAKEERIEN